MTVYKVTYDIRCGRVWQGGGNPNGYTSRSVVSSGDARAACSALERHELRRGRSYDGTRRINAVYIFRVEIIASDVLCARAP